MTSKWYVNEEKAWFKTWWPKDMPKNVEIEEFTMGEFFERQRKKTPNNNLFWFMDSWMTYDEVGQLIDKVATSLHNYGLRKGDVLGLLMPNCIQYFVFYYACQKLGVIIAGLNPTYKSLEILHQIETCNVKALVSLEPLFDMLIKSIIDKTNIEFVITTGIADLVKGNLSFEDFLTQKTSNIEKSKIDFDPSYSFYELLTIEPNLPDVQIDPVEHPSTYLMTGGTTGVPKACVLTHYNLIALIQQASVRFGDKHPNLTSIGMFPAFHISGVNHVILSRISQGGWCLLLSSPPSVEDLLKTIKKLPVEGIYFAMAELYYKRMAEFPDIDKYRDTIKKFQLNLCGAGPLHDPVRNAFEKVTGGRLVDAYGLTESSGGVSAGTFFSEYPVGTIGIPFAGTDWAIFDPDDFEKGPIADGLPGSNYGPDHPGELCACGPQMMKEYLNKPEATADTLKEWDGRIWLRTGDIGFMSEDGTVTLRDRKKLLIKVAGHSVFPTEVETMLMRHEAVSEAAVAGFTDPKGKVGEIAKAWVQLKPDFKGKITEDELKAWMNENITYWKVPALIEFIEEVPKNAVGKVQRRALQEADPLFK